MANEIQFARQVSSKTMYAAIRDRSANVWDAVAESFVAITAVTWADAKITLTEQGSTGDYYGTFPTAVADGGYTLEVFEQVDGTRKGDLLLATVHVLWIADRMYYDAHALRELVGDDVGDLEDRSGWDGEGDLGGRHVLELEPHAGPFSGREPGRRGLESAPSGCPQHVDQSASRSTLWRMATSSLPASSPMFWKSSRMNPTMTRW